MPNHYQEPMGSQYGRGDNQHRADASTHRGHNPDQQEPAPLLPELLPLFKNEELNVDIFKQDYLEKIAASVKNVSRSQMRRLFGELKKYKFYIEKGKKYEQIYPHILMEKAKLSYLCKRMTEKDRKNALYYTNLKTLVFKLIDMCNSSQAYIAFVTFFEAMFGYYFEVSKPEGRQ